MQLFRRMLRVCLMVLLSACVQPGFAQQPDACPRGYVANGNSCYNFVFNPTLTFQEAEVACQQHGAFLVSVESTSEHQFVSSWLTRQDPNRHVWLTSGVQSNSHFRWISDQSDITTHFFPSDEIRNQRSVDQLSNIPNNLVVYRYWPDEDEFMWGWGRIMVPSPYICELKKSDVWKYYQKARDFTFGTGITDPNAWPRGPNITSQSENTVFVSERDGTVRPFSIECFATGNPAPTYKWYIERPGRSAEEIQPSSRYAITNGKLTLNNPHQENDIGNYICEAENIHGKVLSSPIAVSVGQLGEFSNVPTSPYRTPMYQGVEMACNPPVYKPAATFNWYKGDVTRFVRPQYNKHTFLSRNGMLYISEVTASDSGDYHCMVALKAKEGDRLSTLQPPARTSLPIRLTVQGENANTYGPDIQDKFPQVFPPVPLIGRRMEIECFAYGRLPLTYSWKRLDAPMNPKAYTRDSGRVLVFGTAELQDTGRYECRVQGQATKTKAVYVTMSGPPFFPYPLKDQHVDQSDKFFTWTCNSIAVPTPTYAWYKDGVKLSVRDNDLGITVRRNQLIFDEIDGAKHNGMYQCEASNAIGTRRTSAQLRAVAFAPTFERLPVKQTARAAAGGNITILCEPEAAPRATITWLRNGGSLGGNALVLPNGALELFQLQSGDSGTYTCVATNSLGDAQSSCQLQVSEGTSLIETPADDTVPLNGTVSLDCKASYDVKKGDIVYVWKLNDHTLDFTRHPAYSTPYVSQGDGTLFIVDAQYEHEGDYACHVTSVVDEVSQSGYITVAGPPGEPAGIHAHTVNSKDRIVDLWWQPGQQHVYPVSKHTIQFKSVFEDTWVTFREGVPDAQTKIESYEEWRGLLIKDVLAPGTSYAFRVISGTNEIGYGPPSMASTLYKMDDAAPIHAPTDVGGGGGSEGELHMTWKPLPRSQWGSQSIKYVVHYRLKDRQSFKDQWITTEEMSQPHFYTTVSRDLYYMPYEVKVHAQNSKGAGPNSTVVIVYSAEMMPTITPLVSDASAINATAAIIEWQPMPNTREVVKGEIFAFQINYWLEDTLCSGRNEKNALFTRIYGNINSGTIIGLSPGGDYCFTLQLLNHAGLGPKTDFYGVGLNDPAPSNYPEFVTVTSHGPESVRVFYRAISPVFGELPLKGYKAWWWDMRDNIRTANQTDFGKTSVGVIHGIQKNVIYKLRVVPYNDGGDGAKSPAVFFTLGGMVAYDPSTTEVMNSAPRGVASPFYLQLFLLSWLAILSSAGWIRS